MQYPLQVSRFNQEGIAALEPLHGGGPSIVYDSNKRQLILQTIKIITLFHPADGQVLLKGVESTPNKILNPWLKENQA